MSSQKENYPLLRGIDYTPHTKQTHVPSARPELSDFGGNIKKWLTACDYIAINDKASCRDATLIASYELSSTK